MNHNIASQVSRIRYFVINSKYIFFLCRFADKKMFIMSSNFVTFEKALGYNISRCFGARRQSELAQTLWITDLARNMKIRLRGQLINLQMVSTLPGTLVSKLARTSRRPFHIFTMNLMSSAKYEYHHRMDAPSRRFMLVQVHGSRKHTPQAE